MLRIKIMTLALLICLVALFASTGYAANDFPSKPITIIVPFGPGGGTDMALRPIMAVAEKYFGQPFVAVYKPGAGGVTALAETAQEKPDGYTLIMPSIKGFLITPHIETLPYTFDDFQAIAKMVEAPLYFAVQEDSPWKTIDEFVNASKKAPASFKVATAGVLTPQHVIIEILKNNYGANLTAIPFEGGAQSLTALLGGHVDASIDWGTLFMPQVEAGDLRILASASSERNPKTPEIPTLKEKGYDIEIGSWSGFYAPRGISPERIAFLEEAFKGVSEDATYKDLMEEMGSTIDYMNSKDYQAYMEKLNNLYLTVLKVSGYEIK